MACRQQKDEYKGIDFWKDREITKAKRKFLGNTLEGFDLRFARSAFVMKVASLFIEKLTDVSLDGLCGFEV